MNKTWNRFNPQKITTFFKNLGPGIVTGASDDDPSGIATYSQAGAQFGFATLWTAFITFPLMLSIQEMSARIGMVTAQGLTCIIKKHYPKPILALIILLSLPAILLNIGADIAGMGAVAHLVFPHVPAFVYSIVFTLLLMGILIFFSYKRTMAILKYLCLSLLLYIAIPFLLKPNWLAILKNTLMPEIQLNKQYISVLVAILGTTISPYLFFWQATMEAEKRKETIIDKHSITDMKKDVFLGMFSSNLVMYFIILTTGMVLFQNGINQIDTVEQAAKALEPIAGEYAYLLFAAGVIGTGFLAIPVLCGSLSYILSTALNWTSGLDARFSDAKPFYLTIIISLLIGLVINLSSLSPINALFYTAVLYGITAPPLIIIILFIANNEKIMGKYTNGLWSNVGGIITLLLMSIAALLLLIL